MIQVLKNTASSTQSRQIMSGYERLTDGYNCENKNVHVHGKESKLITSPSRAGWVAWDSNPPLTLDFSGLRYAVVSTT
jgi:hypothetical protein